LKIATIEEGEKNVSSCRWPFILLLTGDVKPCSNIIRWYRIKVHNYNYVKPDELSGKRKLTSCQSLALPEIASAPKTCI
jgi:hypothetical protein